MSIRINSSTLGAVLLMLFAGPALAFCLPYPGHIRVGADPVHCQANDIQSAINLAGACPVIIDITREHLYTHQHLAISDKYITFQGWGDGVFCADIPSGPFDNPPYAPPASTQPLVTIDGSNDGFGSVLWITGNSNVGLHNLAVTGGLTNDGGSGGGIHFDGQGSLYLINSLINLNHGGYGGAINVNGSSGPTNLYLMDHTQILTNTAAVSGGGVRIEGNTHLYALSPFTLIGFNHAPNGYGGGLEVLGPAHADIGSPGYNGLAVIYDNDAQNGGGIAAIAINESEYASVNLFTTDPHNPVQVTNNTATAQGGGVYTKPHASAIGGSGGVSLCAFDFRINDNLAAQGSAISGDWDSSGFVTPDRGSFIAMNTTDDECAPPTALGALACAPGVHCNELTGNITEDANAQPTDGATIYLGNASYLYANRLIMRNNQGGRLIDATEGGYFGDFMILNNCLIVDNQTQHELLHMIDGTMEAYNCTFANNAIANGYVMYADGTGDHMHVGIIDDIFDMPGVSILDYPGSTSTSLIVHDVLAPDISTLPGTLGIVQGRPTFVGAANGDYHLRHSSLGVDVAPPGTGLDLDSHTRTVDLPDVPNGPRGPLDLGAYEIQLACAGNDTIFCDGFDG